MNLESEGFPRVCPILARNFHQKADTNSLKRSNEAFRDKNDKSACMGEIRATGMVRLFQERFPFEIRISGGSSGFCAHNKRIRESLRFLESCRGSPPNQNVGIID